MGAGRSCSVALGVVEEEDKTQNLPTARLTPTSVLKDLQFAVTGGLLQTQLLYYWNTVFSYGPAINERQARALLTRVVTDYPDLAEEAVKLSMRKLDQLPADEKNANVATNKKTVLESMERVHKVVREHHRAIIVDQRQLVPLVDKWITHLRIPVEGKMSQAVFLREFQYSVGPGIFSVFVFPEKSHGLPWKFKRDLMQTLTTDVQALV